MKKKLFNSDCIVGVFGGFCYENLKCKRGEENKGSKARAEN